MEETTEKTHDLNDISKLFQGKLTLFMQKRSRLKSFDQRHSSFYGQLLDCRASQEDLLKWLIIQGAEQIFNLLLSIWLKHNEIKLPQIISILREAAGSRLLNIISYAITNQLIENLDDLLDILLNHNKLDFNEKIDFIRLVLSKHPNLIAGLLRSAQELFHPTEAIIVILSRWLNNLESSKDLEVIRINSYLSEGEQFSLPESIPEIIPAFLEEQFTEVNKKYEETIALKQKDLTIRLKATLKDLFLKKNELVNIFARRPWMNIFLSDKQSFFEAYRKSYHSLLYSLVNPSTENLVMALVSNEFINKYFTIHQMLDTHLILENQKDELCQKAAKSGCLRLLSLYFKPSYKPINAWQANILEDLILYINRTTDPYAQQEFVSILREHSNFILPLHYQVHESENAMQGLRTVLSQWKEDLANNRTTRPIDIKMFFPMVEPIFSSSSSNLFRALIDNEQLKEIMDEVCASIPLHDLSTNITSPLSPSFSLSIPPQDIDIPSLPSSPLALSPIPGSMPPSTFNKYTNFFDQQEKEKRKEAPKRGRKSRRKSSGPEKKTRRN